MLEKGDEQRRNDRKRGEWGVSQRLEDITGDGGKKSALAYSNRGGKAWGISTDGNFLVLMGGK